MAALAAFIIPIGTLVAGEGLAAIVLERRIGVDYREVRWREVEFTLVYRAVFVRFLQQGLNEREARQRAVSQVKGYLKTGDSSAVRLLSAPDGQGGQGANGQADSVKASVHAYLRANPDIATFSVNQVLAALKQAGVEAGRTTVAEALKEFKTVEVA